MQILIENQILPPVSVFCEMIRSETIVIEKHDNYQKRTYRNRFMIATPKGRHLLSVPLKKGKNSLKFTEVRISYDDLWVTSFSNTLKTNYGSAPFFHYYFEAISRIFNKKPAFLTDLNDELRNFIFTSLGIDIPVIYTSGYQKSYGLEIKDLRNKYLPVKFETGVQLSSTYNQVYENLTGFIQDVSIIDLLFNTGKFGLNYLIDQPSK